jgi:hypothetical protein
MPRLFSYVVRYDVGFAPNPFYGWCTFGTCRADIRKKARPGDWILGTGSGDTSIRRAGHLVYAMHVEEVLTFETYWADPRFASKRPSMHGSLKRAYGDNVYHRGEAGQWLQEDSRHTFDDGSANPGHIIKDTSANAVLISQRYAYFGGSGPPVPAHLRTGPELDLVHSGIGVRCQFGETRFNSA